MLVWRLLLLIMLGLGGVGVRSYFFHLWVVFVFSSGHLLAEPAQPGATSGSVAEVTLYDSFLRQFGMSGTEPKVSQVNGHDVYSTISYSASPVTANSNNQIQFNLNVRLDGNSTGTGVQPVGRKHSAGATVNTTIAGDFTKPVHMTADGVYPGALLGTPSLNYSVSTFNDLGLGRRIAHRRAARQANAETQAQIPIQKNEIRNEVSGSTDDAINQANETFTQQMKKLSPLISDPKTFPFSSALSSRVTGADAWGFMKWELKGEGRERGVKPSLENPHQAASVSYMNEELIEKTLTPRLKGKQMKMITVHEILCDGKFGTVLKFCEEKMDEKTANASILFDEDEPLKIKFDKGSIRLTLNAIHQLHKEAKADEQLFTEPAKPEELRFKGLPYAIETTYKVRGAHLDRTSLRVTDRSGVTEKPDWKHEESKKKERGALQLYLDEAERVTLTATYGNAFKKRVDIEPVSFPVNWTGKGMGPNKTKEMAMAGSMFPLEVKAENGWLGFSNYFCREGMPPLGVNYQEIKYGNGAKGLRLTQVLEGSPALLAGLRTGDTIWFFKNAGAGEFTQVGNPNEEFGDLASAAGKGKSLEDRSMQVKGVDASGKEFERAISVCPSGYEHRKKAQELVDKANKVNG